MIEPTIVWFRDDLRVDDNPALVAAAERGEPVVALFVLDEESEGIRPLGGAARWWLHGSLHSLSQDLASFDITLILRRGAAQRVVPTVAAEISAGAVLWNRRYGRPERDIDATIKTQLRGSGVTCGSFAASLLYEPWEVQTTTGTPYSVFTPFWRACRELPHPRGPLPPPSSALSGFDGAVTSELLRSWELRPTSPDWATGLADTWTIGEEAALERCEEFIDDHLAEYTTGRDVPSQNSTSGLSPHLRWGEISPHRVWHAVHSAEAPAQARETFLSELGWREFAWHTLYYFPSLATRNLRPQFDHFPWPPCDPAHLSAWQRGNTGYGLVDAGMRELWQTGTMHNRVRMVTASFLVKNLLIDWRQGERWFWDTLVDADAASNPFNWQWVAGSGADAAPYFRIFNPERQQSRFDPRHRYIARWAPEYIDDDPPEPIVQIAPSRRAALRAFENVPRKQHAP
ncbi:cryptochrome/photolyase family protein [Paramicrobacterium fandaimingii]|uniref:cryptochrome/photolyase family protein n=1 Tax=Paramicrobacterium fandaimingii TaxID=2708079 RepID=UPI001AB03621|nr:deoxyribodipyrimidine photo-lyase [Microbacterium fandaimingii]